MTNESTTNAPRNRRTLRLLAAGGATAALLAAGSVAAVAASGTGTPTPKPSATASPGQPGPGTGVRPSPRVHKPHMAGSVTAASGSTITITDREGFTREIKVSGSTTYTDGLTAIPKVGDKIHAEGTVDTDKTTLDATRVRLMTEHAPHGAGGGPGTPRGPGGTKNRGHGERGAGGPDGHGPGGTASPRPSGAPTPSPSTKP